MFSSDRVRYLPLPGRKDEFYLIRMHPDLYAKLASLVGPKRENIYYDVYCTFANKKDSYRLAIFLGEGIFTMGYSKNYI